MRQIRTQNVLVLFSFRASSSPSPPRQRVREEALGAQRPNPRDFNALNFLDPIWSSPSQAALILTPPRRGERAHGQRPMRRRGAIERDWAGGGYSSVSGPSIVGKPARRRR